MSKWYFTFSNGFPNLKWFFSKDLFFNHIQKLMQANQNARAKSQFAFWLKLLLSHFLSLSLSLSHVISSYGFCVAVKCCVLTSISLAQCVCVCMCASAYQKVLPFFAVLLVWFCTQFKYKIFALYKLSLSKRTKQILLRSKRNGRGLQFEK